MDKVWYLEHDNMELCVGKCTSGRYKLVSLTSDQALKFSSEEEAIKFKYENLTLLEKLKMVAVTPKDRAYLVSEYLEDLEKPKIIKSYTDLPPVLRTDNNNLVFLPGYIAEAQREAKFQECRKNVELMIAQSLQLAISLTDRPFVQSYIQYYFSNLEKHND